MGSFERFGYVAPMVLNESSGRLLAGHGRLDELKMLQADGKPPPEGIRVKDGEWLAPVVMGVRLGAQAGKAYTIADNRMVELGGWDEPRLVDALISLSNGNLDGTGYDRDDVDQLIRLYRPELLGPEPPEPEINRAAELQKKWGTELGQLWEIGEHRLICGDCTDRAVVEKVMQGEKADCIWTDPPYGVSYTGGAKEREPIENDDDISIATQGIKLSSEFIELGGVIYCAAPPARLFEFWDLFVGAGYHYSTLLVWVKNNMAGGWGDYRGAYENIFYGWKKGASHYWSGARDKTTVFKFDKPISSDEHPTMKPVELVEEHINNSTVEGEAIYDPFLGSGTTLVACERLDRQGRGIEISPAYVAVALERLSQMGLKPKLVSD